jgi:hypothetical protein
MNVSMRLKNRALWVGSTNIRPQRDLPPAQTALKMSSSFEIMPLIGLSETP